MLVIETSDTGYVVWKHGYPQKVWLFNTEKEVIDFRNGFYGIFDTPMKAFKEPGFKSKIFYDYTKGGYDG